MRNNLGQWQGRSLDIEAALDDLKVRRDAPQVLVGRLVGQIPQADRLADLPGSKELFELRNRGLEGCGGTIGIAPAGKSAYLGGNIQRSVWDMEVANY